MAVQGLETGRGRVSRQDLVLGADGEGNCFRSVSSRSFHSDGDLHKQEGYKNSVPCFVHR